MHVETSQPRRIQHRAGQDQSVGGDDQQIQVRIRKGGAFQGCRVTYLDAVLASQFLYRAGREFPAPAGGPVRLGEHKGNVLTALQQAPQDDGCEFRGTGEAQS